ncbi:three-helix bundle dimerization domain-containing protein [Umezawaea sp. NPDC059074]|uniref:three-helix bundle dimerization domain-containing protein n=1 Tax=Umezawaea sp. NPDC059074 TaxID=3346716 RepID=UPI0036958DED
MTTTPAMDDLTADEHVQYAKLEQRLVDDYGDTAEAVVHHAVEQERDRFADASVHSFVPVLVERSVRARLGRPAGS